MTVTNPNRLILAAIGAVVFSMAFSADAQYATENNTGRLLDANNRLGSGGRNDGGVQPGGVTADDIVYGNVTRGLQFRGRTTADPQEFRGQISRPSESLVQEFGPGVYEQGAIVDQTPQRFFGETRGVRPPEGFERLSPGTSGYFATRQEVFRTPGDLRLDAAIPNPDMSLPRAGELIGAGPIYSLGPQYTMPEPVVQQYAAVGEPQREGEAGSMPSRELMRRLHLDESQIQRMREELQREALEEGGEDALPPEEVTRGPETPVNEALNTRNRLSSEVGSTAVGRTLSTEQTMRQRMVTNLPSAAMQSSQYAELQNRLQRFRQRQQLTDQQANAAFMEQWRKMEEAKRQEQLQRQEQMQQQPALDQPQARQGEVLEEEEAERQVDAARIAARQAEEAKRIEGLLPPQPDIPLKIASFADGVKASGLKRLLTQAENAMQEGKFTQALDYYDAAASVAPNNPLILMGRSVAELGGGYYARAQLHLQDVLTADPALLMARYDLKHFYGEDRLQYLVRDLKDLASRESQQARPLFLLAFVAYNTESQERAADYLNLAEQRGGSAEFYNALREHWRLKESQKAPSASQP